MTNIDEHFSAAFSIDNVIFKYDDQDGELSVLLVKRAEEPFAGEWSLPGKLVNPAQSIEEVAQELYEELTHNPHGVARQVQTFGEIQRHPDGRVLTVAFYCLVRDEECQLTPVDGIASDLKWERISNLGELPFDHNDIVEAALTKFRNRIRFKPFGFELLPRKFTLTQLQNLFETTLQMEFDKRNFRRKISSMKLLDDTMETLNSGLTRPAKLYAFDQAKFEQMVEEGFNFEL